MRKYGHFSWKRTWVWSNRKEIAELDMGPLTPEERRESQPTTTRYRDKHGKMRYKGNKRLKLSQ